MVAGRQPQRLALVTAAGARGDPYLPAGAIVIPVAVADAVRQRHTETDMLRREVAAALRQLWGAHDSEPPRGARRVRDLEAPAADDDAKRRIGSRQQGQRLRRRHACCPAWRPDDDCAVLE